MSHTSTRQIKLLPLFSLIRSFYRINNQKRYSLDNNYIVNFTTRRAYTLTSYSFFLMSFFPCLLSFTQFTTAIPIACAFSPETLSALSFVTTTSGGKLIFHIFGALAEFERDIIRERTNAGLQAARARGRLGGRPKAKTLNTPKKVALAQSLYDEKNNTIDEICKTLNISRATLYRYIQTKQKDA